MRCTVEVMKNVRLPRPGPVPLRAVKSVNLKNEITQRDRFESAVFCLNEMQALMSCWKSSDYDQASCQQYADKLDDCYLRNMTAKMSRADKMTNLAETSEVNSASKRLSRQDANKLLKSFPNPK